jgi:hypothetical protein
MRGNIYLIYNDVNNYIYIGSCINNINKRLYNHRYNKTTSLYKYINNSNDINWDNLKIREIDFIDTDNINELRKKEGEYIKTFKKDINYNVINCFIAGRNDKEYYMDNKDIISSVYLRKSGKTKDQIKQYNKSTEKTYNYYKNYRDKNKDKIKSYQYEYRKNKLGQSK